MQRSAFITGTAGFVGFHLAKLLLEEGWAVAGFDAVTDYYDVRLKRARLAILGRFDKFVAHEARLEDLPALQAAAVAARPDIIVHLAAQAGVRHSLEQPRQYVDTNIVGSFNLLEVARHVRPQHLLMASTSSVYGANTKIPFSEADRADAPLTIYAATKKACEAMAHSYAHLHEIPTTLFRFFTVYGAWGRPDMAYFKFAESIQGGRPIDVYNHGDMSRDFTYVGDLVRSIRGLIDAVPRDAMLPTADIGLISGAAFRIVNIGNGRQLPLMDLINAIENAMGRKAQLNLLPMQDGDVKSTWADADLLRQLIGYVPETSLEDGVTEFVRWFETEYQSLPKGH